ncbi:MAG TPA: hypothetical protein V6C69_00440 [Trichormus sp.]
MQLSNHPLHAPISANAQALVDAKKVYHRTAIEVSSEFQIFG